MTAELRKATPGTEPRVRASDAEREEVVERLREATAEGRLTLEELADRCEAAYLARYRDDLDRIAADLPAPEAASAPVHGTASGATGIYRSKGGDATYDRPEPDASGRITATSGLGDLTLNLAHVRAPSTGELRVTAKAWAGDVRLIVPEGVDLRVKGSVRDRTGKRKKPVPKDAPRVHVTGTAVLGDVVVQSPRGRSSWREWIEEAVDTALDFL
ncbi:DUF1707 domain-containing protein [Streptomyces sp. NPDC048172]|uniref:DUF1707 SHOCT-like domain-containing protein n=1 Tax=Streptomyces sp. NPDC048172 TaxID=3365505 RepID=UPI00371EB099